MVMVFGVFISNGRKWVYRCVKVNVLLWLYCGERFRCFGRLIMRVIVMMVIGGCLFVCFLFLMLCRWMVMSVW